MLGKFAAPYEGLSKFLLYTYESKTLKINIKCEY